MIGPRVIVTGDRAATLQRGEVGRREEGGSRPQGQAGRKEKAAAQVAEPGQAAPQPKPRAAGGETDLLTAMEAMKPLVASLGADKVKRIVDLL